MREKAVLCFDAETIPDAELLRRSLQLPDASDAEVVEQALQAQREKTDGRSDFLPLVFHQVVSISVVYRAGSTFLVGSKSTPLAEKEIISHFFQSIASKNPILVSWNGSGFDMPMLVLRALRHGVNAQGYWTGPRGARDFNKYTKRYDDKGHQDVMDILAHYQAGNKTSLANAALACDLPGKMGYDGSQVLGLHRSGKHDEIRNYCEIDALNTYLIWLRLQLSTGALDQATYAQEVKLVEDYLGSAAPHLQDFLQQWRDYRAASQGSST